MSDDALLSMPARSAMLQSSGWQEGRMDEGAGRTPGESQMHHGGWEAPWMATGGHPSGDNHFSPPIGQATGRYGPGYGDEGRHFSTDAEWQRQRPDQAHGAGGPHHDEHHHHYRQFRQEHERQLDEDYQAWRRHRFQSDFEGWRQQRGSSPPGQGHGGAPRQDAGRSEGMLQGLGRAITEVVTGPREPGYEGRGGYNERDQAFDGGTERERRDTTDRFFERS